MLFSAVVYSVHCSVFYCVLYLDMAKAASAFDVQWSLITYENLGSQLHQPELIT